MLTPAEAAQAWREADEPRKGHALAVLGEAIRHAAEQHLIRLRLPTVVCEDLAQDVTAKLLAWTQAGKTEPGKENGLVAISAKNAGFTWRRHNGRVVSLPEEEDISSTGASPEDSLDQAQQGRMLSEILRTATGKARQHADLILEHYVNEKPMDALIAEELARPGPATLPLDPEKSERRARDRVYQRLSRAREWLREQLAAAELGKRERD